MKTFSWSHPKVTHFLFPAGGYSFQEAIQQLALLLQTHYWRHKWAAGPRMAKRSPGDRGKKG
jgi:hypothetical protein